MIALTVRIIKMEIAEPFQIVSRTFNRYDIYVTAFILKMSDMVCCIIIIIQCARRNLIIRIIIVYYYIIYIFYHMLQHAANT